MNKKIILLKVLSGNVSPFQNMKYEIGKEYSCTNFDTDEEKDCASGYYATDWDGLSYAYRRERSVYKCVVSGRRVEYNQSKRRYEKIKLVRKLTLKEIKDGLKAASEEAGYDLYHASFPVNPLKGNPKKVTDKEIELLKIYVSVRASIRASIGASIGASVWASVWESVWASVRDSVGAPVRASIGASVGASVWDSVWESVWAYISSLFFNIEEWKGIEHEIGKNPYQPCIDLWLAGFVPSYDGQTWRLYSGKDATVVYVEETG
jgi:hypothetical protein